MVRTRFAPSPTGYLHIGGVRTALFNWLFARHHGGQFILRIDDTDVRRNIDEALQPILDSFRWLGIDWDEGPGVGGPYAPYFQSQRADRYRDAVRRLLEHGVAYRDYARPEEIQAEREIAQREKRRFLYSRRWLAETDEQAGRLEAEGRTASVRLKMPRDGTCAFRDLVRGDVGFEWALEQDHVIQRADGSFLYSLASTVDDHDFRITHVIRAVEHLSNTPRQIFIARALGYDVPHYAHVPYVAQPGSAEKLSKRKIEKSLKHVDFKKLYDHGVEIAKAGGHDPSATTFTPVSVDFYRQVGYLPDAILNYLLLLGWSLDDRTEALTREEMVEHFSLERVNKSPASFDPLKLWAFQDRYMRAVPIEQKVTLVLPYLQGAGFVTSPAPADVADTLTRMLQAAGDRIKVAGDILGYSAFFLPDDQFPYDEHAFDKRVRKDGAPELLRGVEKRLAAARAFDAPTLDALVHAFVESEGVPISRIIHALRVAVTGKPVGFGLFDGLAILGRDRCLARIGRALARV